MGLRPSLPSGAGGGVNMSVTIRCPNPDCGKQYQVREESLGGHATCKDCGMAFTLEMKADETASPKLALPPGLAPPGDVLG